MILAPVTSFRLAIRSFAVNIPLALSAIGTFAGVYGVVSFKSAASKRRDFLKALADNKAILTGTLMTFMDSKDPAALARQMLADKDLDHEIGAALRRALILLL